MLRTIAEIIAEAEATKSVQELIALWDEIAKHKKKYCLADIELAKQRIIDLAEKAEGPVVLKLLVRTNLSQMQYASLSDALNLTQHLLALRRTPKPSPAPPSPVAGKCLGKELCNIVHGGGISVCYTCKWEE